MREVAQDARPDLHFWADVIKTLQEALESHLVGLLERMNLCEIHAKCVMIVPKDMQLAQRT